MNLYHETEEQFEQLSEDENKEDIKITNDTIESILKSLKNVKILDQMKLQMNY